MNPSERLVKEKFNREEFPKYLRSKSPINIGDGQVTVCTGAKPKSYCKKGEVLCQNSKTDLNSQRKIIQILYRNKGK